MSAMDGNVCNSAPVALVANTPKTVLQFRTAANKRAKVTRIKISGDGSNVTATPLIVKIRRQTNGGTMTSVTATQRGQFSDTLQSSGGENATVEPSGPSTVDTFYIPPTIGYDEVLPLTKEIIVAGSGFLGIEITAPAGVNALCSIDFEE